MGLLDFLRREPKPPADTAPRGGSGRAHYQGFLDLEELNQDLRHPQGHTVYDRMYRTDPDVRRVMGMVINPILAATWSVEPYGGDEASDQAKEDADFVHWALFESMTPNLLEHLEEALPVLIRSGFAPFEELWATDTHDGQTVLVPRKLDLRLPRSIQRFEQDELGELSRIHQFVPNKIGQGSGFLSGLIPIDAKDLVYYRVGQEGDNWEGVSLLRPVFKPWFIKDAAEKIDAMALEREAMGIPVAYPPKNATDAQKDAMESVLGAIRAGEQGFLLMPGPHAQDLMNEMAAEGWRFEIVGFSGGESGAGRSAKDTLEYHSDKIAAAFIAEFMRLGQKNMGARAVGDVQKDPFIASVDALASIFARVLTRRIVARIIAFNRPHAEGVPTLRAAITDTVQLDELQTFVVGLVEKGALHPDNDLEDFLRQRANLPPADAKARQAREQQEQQAADLEVKAQEKALTEPAQPPGGKTPTDAPKNATADAPSDAATFARQDRALTSWEQQMCLDQIEDTLNEARGRFEQAGQDAVLSMARTMAEQAADSRQLSDAPPSQLVDALTAELRNLYDMGRATVAHELEMQRAVPSTQYSVQELAATFATEDAPDSLPARALLAARAIAHRMIQAIGRLAVSGQGDRARMQQAAEHAGRQGLRAEAQLNASAALNEGRGDEAQARADEIVGARYTSVLDSNSCPPCVRADDGVLRPLTDPVRLARKPPNPMCEGGERCRCMEFFQLAGETAPSA